MSLCLGAACKLSYWSECWKNTSAEPSTKDGIEAVRLCAFTPPGSSLDRHSVIVFPLTMNNVGSHPASLPNNFILVKAIARAMALDCLAEKAYLGGIFV